MIFVLQGVTSHITDERLALRLSAKQELECGGPIPGLSPACVACLCDITIPDCSLQCDSLSPAAPPHPCHRIDESAHPICEEFKLANELYNCDKKGNGSCGSAGYPVCCRVWNTFGVREEYYPAGVAKTCEEIVQAYRPNEGFHGAACHPKGESGHR